MTAAQDELLKKARAGLAATRHLATGGYYNLMLRRRRMPIRLTPSLCRRHKEGVKQLQSFLSA